MADNGNLAKLITDVKESLERELRDGFATVNTRLDDQAASLDWLSDGEDRLG